MVPPFPGAKKRHGVLPEIHTKNLARIYWLILMYGKLLTIFYAIDKLIMIVLIRIMPTAEASLESMRQERQSSTEVASSKGGENDVVLDKSPNWNISKTTLFFRFLKILLTK